MLIHNLAPTRFRPPPAILAGISTRSAERRSQRGCLLYSREEGLETDDPARLGYRAPLHPAGPLFRFVLISGLQLPPEGVALFKKNEGHPKAPDPANGAASMRSSFLTPCWREQDSNHRSR
jgi:hypothetical protein